MSALCCGPANVERSLLVFAAASTAPALREIAAREPADVGPVAVHVGGSGALVRQIERGAPADVLVAASPEEVERMIAGGLCDGSSRLAVAVNRLVVIVPAEAAPPPDVLALVDPRFARIAIGNPATAPVGRYALDVLDALELRATLEPRLLRAEHAREVLAWVERGEVDAGIVYASDAARRPTGTIASPPIDATLHRPLRYEACVTTRRRDPALSRRARRFVERLADDEARATFERHGIVLAAGHGG